MSEEEACFNIGALGERQRRCLGGREKQESEWFSSPMPAATRLLAVSGLAGIQAGREAGHDAVLARHVGSLLRSSGRARPRVADARARDAIESVQAPSKACASTGSRGLEQSWTASKDSLSLYLAADRGCSSTPSPAAQRLRLCCLAG